MDRQYRKSINVLIDSLCEHHADSSKREDEPNFPPDWGKVEMSPEVMEWGKMFDGLMQYSEH